MADSGAGFDGLFFACDAMALGALEEQAGHALVERVALVHPAERDLVALDELFDRLVADRAGLELQVDLDLFRTAQGLPLQAMAHRPVLASGIVDCPRMVLRKGLVP